MLVVIFKASYKANIKLDDNYFSTAQQLRTLAIKCYRCQGFTSATENSQEIALSYWLCLDDIQAWKNDPIHKRAQVKGASQWYESYSVEIAKIV